MASTKDDILDFLDAKFAKLKKSDKKAKKSKKDEKEKVKTKEAVTPSLIKEIKSQIGQPLPKVT